MGRASSITWQEGDPIVTSHFSIISMSSIISGTMMHLSSVTSSQVTLGMMIVFCMHSSTGSGYDTVTVSCLGMTMGTL